MAHADPRPRFNSYPTPISTNYPPSSSKPYYTYAAATPTSTPTKSHPSSSYHYRQASNASQTRLAAAPVQSSSSRPVPRSSSSIPNPRTASSSVPPPTNRSNTLPSSSESYSHSRKNSMSRPQVPTADAYRSAKREDDRYASARAQQHQQYADAQQRQADAQRQARLIAERDATLKRMEERQRKAQATSWFEESQRLAAVAAEEQRKREDERRRADEKLRRAAQAQVDEERRMHARKQERGHERGRSQTHNPAAAAADKKWYQNIFRDKSRDGRRRDDRGSGSDREPRERAKSEGRAREAVEARERVDKDRARSANSSSTVSAAWASYEKVTSELMDAKPSKGKTSSNLTFYDIPWPILGQANSFHDLTNQNIAAFLLSPHHSQGKSPKSRLRAAILIWHPDKFAQKVLPHVAESHRPAVVAAVNVVARIVTELISSAGN